jgi:hypothetical protein
MNDSSLVLALAIAGLALLNYGVSLWIIREYSRQTFVERDHWRPPGMTGRFRSDAAQFALPLFGIALLVVLMFVLDPWSRGLIGGGVFVLELATLGSNVTDLLAIRALQRPDSAEGRLRYTAGYRYRAGAARVVGMGLVMLVVGVLFGSGAFLAGAALLFATAVGWYRRARQASDVERPV